MGWHLCSQHSLRSRQHGAHVVYRSCYKTIDGPSGALEGGRLEGNERRNKGAQTQARPVRVCKTGGARAGAAGNKRLILGLIQGGFTVPRRADTRRPCRAASCCCAPRAGGLQGLGRRALTRRPGPRGQSNASNARVAGLEHNQRAGGELGAVHGDVAPQQLAHHAGAVVAEHHAARAQVGCRGGRGGTRGRAWPCKKNTDRKGKLATRRGCRLRRPAGAARQRQRPLPCTASMPITPAPPKPKPQQRPRQAACAHLPSCRAVPLRRSPPRGLPCSRRGLPGRGQGQRVAGQTANMGRGAVAPSTTACLPAVQVCRAAPAGC